MKELRHIKW